MHLDILWQVFAPLTSTKMPSARKFILSWKAPSVSPPIPESGTVDRTEQKSRRATLTIPEVIDTKDAFAGFRARNPRLCHLPGLIAQWHHDKAFSHIPWRVRAGLSPTSLLGPTMTDPPDTVNRPRRVSIERKARGKDARCGSIRCCSC